MNSQYPTHEKRNFPPAPRLWTAIGVGIVVMGMAMGTGELIMWPHLVVKYGLGILWLALVGITLQLIINHEVARHSLATGESFFTTSGRVLKWSPIFWLLSAVLLYVWPGWATALGTILTELFGFGSYVMWSWISLGLVLLLTLKGKVAYVMLERSLKIIVPLFLLMLIAISTQTLGGNHLVDVFKGLINFGWIPEGIDMKVLLGAVVFSGAGGMLNLCVSLWYRDKQAGMGAYVGRIENPVTGKHEAIAVSSFTFEHTPENMKNWHGWMRFMRIDQVVIFWFTGLISMVLLAANAQVVLAPQGIIPEGTHVAVAQAAIFGSEWGIWGEKIYLVMAYLMLFSVMWTVFDALTRMVTDIIHTNSRVGPLVKMFHWLEPISVHHLYYGLMTCFILVAAILVPFNQPLGFLLISSVLGGVTMAIYTPILLYANNRFLPRYARPSIFMSCMLGLTAMFYIYFSYLIIKDFFI
ncbi:MAG: Nramp family divalent metal transporter [Candidatus Paceibacterota bacterium]